MNCKSVIYDPSIVYSVPQVADRWQVEKSTIYRMISSGKLPAFRVGKEFRVTDRAVREYEEGVSA